MRNPTFDRDLGLAELQGLYGPFTFPELLLQKLWWRSEYASEQARTADGRPIKVIAPGRWNRLGGPDFKDAVIELEGVRLRGAVEVHLRAEDWDAHRHREDPAYDGVMLHVVLFPPLDAFTRAAGDRLIPILPLLPLLWHDLEEYAADEAVAGLMNRAEHRIAAELAPLPLADLHAMLEPFGQRRWTSKVHYASKRIERLGWVGACHQTALEVLGYRANRAVMLRVASAHPLETWSDDMFNVDHVWESFRGSWTVQGVRPANQPRQRLRQYLRWVRARPNWPEDLTEWGRQANDIGAPGTLWAGGAERRRMRFAVKWANALQLLTAGEVARPRADHLLGDAFLPLLAAKRALTSDSAFTWWWLGYPGDLPDSIRRAMTQLGIVGGHARPTLLGAAQALLGWLFERDLQVARDAAAGSRQGA